MLHRTTFSRVAGREPVELIQDLTQPAPQYPASTGRVLLLVVTAMLVLTQLYAAFSLAGPVSDDLGGNVTFALSAVCSLCYAAGFLFWGPIADNIGSAAGKTWFIIGAGRGMGVEFVETDEANEAPDVTEVSR